jgi:SAM-dependent methyltransferase
VTGCELTAVGVSRLRDTLPGTRVEQVDVGRDALPATTASVDVVTMLDVAYHLVDDAGLDHAIAEVARALRPTGVLIVTDGFQDRTTQPAAHVRFRGRDSWDPMLARHGLAIRRLLPYFRTLSRPRESTWRHWWHPALRGPAEWTMDTALPLRPWLRLAVVVPSDVRP